MNDHWLSPKGQEELRRMSEKPSRRNQHLRLCPGDEGKSEPDDVTRGRMVRGRAHGRYRSVRPGCPKVYVPIPITQSVQSLRVMEYEVASGQSIPNLG